MDNNNAMHKVFIKVSNDFIPQTPQIASECVSKGLHISEIDPMGFIIGLIDDAHFNQLMAVPGVVEANKSDPVL